MVKQPDGSFRILTNTENGWTHSKGLVCTVFHVMPGDRIVVVLEPPVLNPQ